MRFRIVQTPVRSYRSEIFWHCWCPPTLPLWPPLPPGVRDWGTFDPKTISTLIQIRNSVSRLVFVKNILLVFYISKEEWSPRQDKANRIWVMGFRIWKFKKWANQIKPWKQLSTKRTTKTQLQMKLLLGKGTSRLFIFYQSFDPN